MTSVKVRLDLSHIKVLLTNHDQRFTVSLVDADREDILLTYRVNFCNMEDEPEHLQYEITEAEQEGLRRGRKNMQTGSSYAFQHATKPATIGLILSTNPVALLAW
jgi:microsomal epoxide hydrolase